MKNLKALKKRYPLHILFVESAESFTIYPPDSTTATAILQRPKSLDNTMIINKKDADNDIKRLMLAGQKIAFVQPTKTAAANG